MRLAVSGGIGMRLALSGGIGVRLGQSGGSGVRLGPSPGVGVRLGSSRGVGVRTGSSRCVGVGLGSSSRRVGVPVGSSRGVGVPVGWSVGGGVGLGADVDVGLVGLLGGGTVPEGSSCCAGGPGSDGGAETAGVPTSVAIGGADCCADRCADGSGASVAVRYAAIAPSSRTPTGRRRAPPTVDVASGPTAGYVLPASGAPGDVA
jgi:hypothetical protein